MKDLIRREEDDMPTMEQSCCFTGHRPKFFRFGDNEAHPECQKIKDFLHRTIEHLIVEKGVTHFISGGAIGVDTWAAEAVAALKNKHPSVTLEIAMPFPTMWEQFEERDRARYEKLKDKIDKMTEVHPEYTKKCMHDRNRYMVDNAAYLIAVWTGIQTGTGMTVTYAQEQNRQVLCLNPDAAAPGMNKLYFEVVSTEGKQYGAGEMSTDELRALAGFVRNYLAVSTVEDNMSNHITREALQKLHNMFGAAGVDTVESHI